MVRKVRGQTVRRVGLFTIPFVLLLASNAPAANWYAAPGGKSTDRGDQDHAWDIASALDGSHPIAPGDTLWLSKGIYKAPYKEQGMGFTVKLVGSQNAPIQIRALPGQRVTIDGGLIVQPPSTHLSFQDLEITVSEPRPSAPIPRDLSFSGLKRPWGGLNIYTGEGCEYINLVIHDNCQGISFWTGAANSEIYGCIIYDNGWAGTDRGHGHALYTQNRDGVKKITDCIFTGGYGFTLHAYSQAGYVDNYLVQGNITYDSNTFLIGGYKPSHGIHVLGNTFYRAPLQLGYSAPDSDDCEIRGNTIVNGALQTKGFAKVINEGNLVLAPNDARPVGERIILQPNHYDQNRANLAIFNWNKKPIVAVEPGAFLKKGETYRLMNPRDFYGEPVLSGVYTGTKMLVPVPGEFAAFVLLRGQGQPHA